MKFTFKGLCYNGLLAKLDEISGNFFFKIRRIKHTLALSTWADNWFARISWWSRLNIACLRKKGGAETRRLILCLRGTGRGASTPVAAAYGSLSWAPYLERDLQCVPSAPIVGSFICSVLSTFSSHWSERQDKGQFAHCCSRASSLRVDSDFSQPLCEMYSCLSLRAWHRDC